MNYSVFMDTNEIEKRIEEKLPGSKARVEGDGYHFVAHVMSDQFEGLMPVKKQQMVYATVNDLIQDGSIHALTIKAYTPTEWENTGWSD